MNKQDKNYPFHFWKSINWNVLNKSSIEEALVSLLAILKNTQSDDLLAAIQQARQDLVDIQTSTCSVCGDKQSKFTHMNIEHAKLRVHWGYESNKDTQHHELTLCEACYDKYILAPLGDKIKITNYF